MLYNFIIISASAIAKLLSLFDEKIERFFELRKGELDRIENYFSGKASKRVLWFHSSSAGEFEQAKPVIDYIKSNYKDPLIIASFFSPSGYDAGLKYDKIDFCFNLPIDLRKNVRRLLNSINPTAIIFSKYDIWTNLSIEACRRGTKLILLSGTLPEKSFRHKFPLRMFLKRSYNLFSRIYAVSESDAKRFMKIVDNEKRVNIIVAGDTRFDRVKYVIDEGGINPKGIIKIEEDNIYLIAGSTYSISEKILLQTIKGLKQELNNLRFILVPHEVDERNIKRLKRYLIQEGLNPIMYSNSHLPVAIGKDEILVIDAIGILAYLYKQSDIVFVGGSFRGSVHSVLEPAIFGKPILTGPYIENAYEAVRLREEGGLIMCKNRVDLYNSILKLVVDSEYRDTVSKRAKDYFFNNIGATDYIINDLKKIINID